MDSSRVHFEVYVRRTMACDWTLEIATMDRAGAIATAQGLFDDRRAVAAKVTKETLDDENREFRTVTIMSVGAAEPEKKSSIRSDLEPLCVSPQDLYTLHARDRIGRLLDAWLDRHRATVFELLHRPDLVEKLEASGIDLQHAVQKIAVPEAQARGASVHELIRLFHALIERAIERLLRDHQRGILPKLDREGFAVAAERVVHDPDRGYLLGAAVAAALAPAKGWMDKVSRLLDLADAAPADGASRALAIATLEQPLAEILGSKSGLEDILGRGLDLGGTLAAMTRLAASGEVEALIRTEPSVSKVMPGLSPSARRLARWLALEDLPQVKQALGRRILRELNGPRRLRPGDAAGELDVLRGLAMALTCAAGRLLPLEDVQAAFSARSKTLVTADFVDAYLGKGLTALQEVQSLVRLTENVIGASAKREAGRWLQSLVYALRFEKELRAGPDSAAARLAALATVQKAVGRSGLVVEDYEPIQAKIGEIGGMIEADVKLAVALSKASAPLVHRLTLLLRLACGDSAPLGPAADRAKAEALKLVRSDAMRAEMSAAPEQMSAVRDLFQQSGIAA